jgi:hypothetical protein
MFAAIQHINNFTLPPVLVGGICKIIVLELHRLDSYKCFYFHTKTWRTNF